MADMTGTTSDLRARVEELEARIRQLEKREEDIGPIRSLLREIVPPETREHMRAARREQLLAVRAMLDRWIAKTEREDVAETRERIAVD